jgi:hypothetical protein
MDKSHFWSAFFKAQASFTSPKKSGVNGFANGHKYHKLEDLLPAVYKVLSEQSIFFYFEDINQEDQAGVRIWMRHEPSGQGVCQECLVDKKERHAQATGGCYTYAKRYILCSLFLVSDPKLDDDADFATNGKREKSTPKPKLATDETVAKIRAKLADLNVSEEAALSKVGSKTWVITNDQANIIQGRIDQLETAL